MLAILIIRSVAQIMAVWFCAFGVAIEIVLMEKFDGDVSVVHDIPGQVVQFGQFVVVVVRFVLQFLLR